MYYEATESYRMAKEFSNRYLGPTDGISQNLSNIYDSAR